MNRLLCSFNEACRGPASYAIAQTLINDFLLLCRIVFELGFVFLLAQVAYRVAHLGRRNI